MTVAVFVRVQLAQHCSDVRVGNSKCGFKNQVRFRFHLTSLVFFWVSLALVADVGAVCDDFRCVCSGSIDAALLGREFTMHRVVPVMSRFDAGYLEFQMNHPQEYQTVIEQMR